VHGYGGSLVLWYNVVKPLSEKFRLYLIDIPGMGASSRVQFNSSSKQETDDFFTDLLEDWRKEMDITDFFLAAHSYGGYLASLYTLKYSQHIKKLFLISPVGFQQRPDDFDWDMWRCKP